MKKVPISEVKAGMKLARDVYLSDGRILLLSGFVIKPRYIRKLEIFGIPFIYVQEDEIVPPGDISEEVDILS